MCTRPARDGLRKFFTSVAEKNQRDEDTTETAENKTSNSSTTTRQQLPGHVQADSSSVVSSQISKDKRSTFAMPKTSKEQLLTLDNARQNSTETDSSRSTRQRASRERGLQTSKTQSVKVSADRASPFENGETDSSQTGAECSIQSASVAPKPPPVQKSDTGEKPISNSAATAPSQESERVPSRFSGEAKTGRGQESDSTTEQIIGDAKSLPVQRSGVANRINTATKTEPPKESELSLAERIGRAWRRCRALRQDMQLLNQQCDTLSEHLRSIRSQASKRVTHVSAKVTETATKCSDAVTLASAAETSLTVTQASKDIQTSSELTKTSAGVTGVSTRVSQTSAGVIKTSAKVPAPSSKDTHARVLEKVLEPETVNAVPETPPLGQLLSSVDRFSQSENDQVQGRRAKGQGESESEGESGVQGDVEGQSKRQMQDRRTSVFYSSTPIRFRSKEHTLSSRSDERVCSEDRSPNVSELSDKARTPCVSRLLDLSPVPRQRPRITAKTVLKSSLATEYVGNFDRPCKFFDYFVHDVLGKDSEIEVLDFEKDFGAQVQKSQNCSQNGERTNEDTKPTESDKENVDASRTTPDVQTTTSSTEHNQSTECVSEPKSAWMEVLDVREKPPYIPLRIVWRNKTEMTGFSSTVSKKCDPLTSDPASAASELSSEAAEAGSLGNSDAAKLEPLQQGISYLSRQNRLHTVPTTSCDENNNYVQSRYLTTEYRTDMISPSLQRTFSLPPRPPGHLSKSLKKERQGTLTSCAKLEAGPQKQLTTKTSASCETAVSKICSESCSAVSKFSGPTHCNEAFADVLETGIPQSGITKAQKNEETAEDIDTKSFTPTAPSTQLSGGCSGAKCTENNHNASVSGKASVSGFAPEKSATDSSKDHTDSDTDQPIYDEIVSLSASDSDFEPVSNHATYFLRKCFTPRAVRDLTSSTSELLTPDSSPECDKPTSSAVLNLKSRPSVLTYISTGPLTRDYFSDMRTILPGQIPSPDIRHNHVIFSASKLLPRDHDLTCSINQNLTRDDCQLTFSNDPVLTPDLTPENSNTDSSSIPSPDVNPDHLTFPRNEMLTQDQANFSTSEILTPDLTPEFVVKESSHASSQCLTQNHLTCLAKTSSLDSATSEHLNSTSSEEFSSAVHDDVFTTSVSETTPDSSPELNIAMRLKRHRMPVPQASEDVLASVVQTTEDLSTSKAQAHKDISTSTTRAHEDVSTSKAQALAPKLTPKSYSSEWTPCESEDNSAHACEMILSSKSAFGDWSAQESEGESASKSATSEWTSHSSLNKSASNWASGSWTSVTSGTSSLMPQAYEDQLTSESDIDGDKSVTSASFSIVTPPAAFRKRTMFSSPSNVTKGASHIYSKTELSDISEADFSTETENSGMIPAREKSDTVLSLADCAIQAMSVRRYATFLEAVGKLSLSDKFVLDCETGERIFLKFDTLGNLMPIKKYQETKVLNNSCVESDSSSAYLTESGAESAQASVASAQDSATSAEEGRTSLSESEFPVKNARDGVTESFTNVSESCVNVTEHYANVNETCADASKPCANVTAFSYADISRICAGFDEYFAGMGESSPEQNEPCNRIIELDDDEFSGFGESSPLVDFISSRTGSTKTCADVTKTCDDVTATCVDVKMCDGVKMCDDVTCTDAQDSSANKTVAPCTGNQTETLTGKKEGETEGAGETEVRRSSGLLPTPPRRHHPLLARPDVSLLRQNRGRMWNRSQSRSAYFPQPVILNLNGSQNRCPPLSVAFVTNSGIFTRTVQADMVILAPSARDWAAL